MGRSGRESARRPEASHGRRDGGQVLVIFGLALVVLLAGAGLAIDIGRFYGERRFLQNAADAAALAAANSLIRGESTSAAEAEARSVLARNFLVSPNGVVPALPPTSPVYESGHAGDPRYLMNGILISGGDVRVAVLSEVDYTFGRVVGLDASAIGARARVNLNGNLLPIAVRRQLNPPGPNSGASAPCTDNTNQYLDFFATADTACLGTESNPALRTAPSAGSGFDPTNPDNDRANHGPIITILGQGAQPQNGVDFRGFVALDIRNFAGIGTQTYYNGVTTGTNANTLKSMESDWIRAGGYPGPGFPPATIPPDPADQVATMSGNSTGIAIDAMLSRFAPGDEILVAVYPGIVNAIPDFSMSQPPPIVVPETGTVPNAGSFKVSRNQSFTGQVTLSTIPDLDDPDNPMLLGTLLGGGTPITYNPNPVTPSTGSGEIVLMTNISTSGATPGVYVVWIRGEAGSPYLTTKLEPATLVVGNVVRDFSITSSSQQEEAAAPGSNVTFSLTLKNAPNSSTSFGGPVSLSVDGPLPAGVGAITFGSTSVTPNRNGNSTSLTINTGTMAPGRYRFVVRAKGMNGDPTPRPVTHLLPLTVDVPPVLTGNSGVYVDIVGFAVMRIAAMNTNSIDAYAITPVIPDMNDHRLRRGQTARLVPWN